MSPLGVAPIVMVYLLRYRTHHAIVYCLLVYHTVVRKGDLLGKQWLSYIRKVCLGVHFDLRKCVAYDYYLI